MKSDQFEEWYEKRYGKNSKYQLGFKPHYQVFMDQSISFQWGVYLEYIYEEDSTLLALIHGEVYDRIMHRVESLEQIQKDIINREFN